jgi:hypothetical protein
MSDSQYIQKDRGWGLTILIPLTILGSGIGIIIMVLDLLFNLGIYSTLSLLDKVWSLIQSLLIIAFLVAAWRWKRWGCFGLILLAIIGAAINLIRGAQPITLIASVVGIAFLYGVYRSKAPYFE